MIAIVVVVAILLSVLAIVVGFYSGIRYAFRNLLPLWIARMTPKELEELGRRAAAERGDVAPQ